MAQKDEQIAEIVYMIAENFGVNASERMLFMWLNLLAEYDMRVIQKAALNLIRKTGNEQVAYKTMPPFAMMQREIDAIVGSVSDKDELTGLKAESAWNGLLEAIETYGSYQTPQDLDKTTLYCVKSLGGWQHVCSWREEDLNWRKKEFVDLFRSSHGRTDELLAGVDAVEALGIRKHDTLKSGTMTALIGSVFDRLEKAGKKAVNE